MIELSRYRNHLTKLRKTIFDGVSYFIVWQALAKEYEDSFKTFGQHKGFWWQYRGFFSPARKALLASALMQFSKAYDKHRRTISLHGLLNTALQNPELYAPNSSTQDLQDILSRIDRNDDLLRRLKRQRDKSLAHQDADLVEDIELPPTEVHTLAEETKSIYNALWFSHKGEYDSFDYWMEDVVQHTAQVISSMKETENGG